MDIVHDPATQRFQTVVDGLDCVCDYRLDARKREAVFTHTYVPDALRGRGVAAALVHAALEWAQAQGLRVVPACSYVQTYLRRHPEWQGLQADRGH